MKLEGDFTGILSFDNIFAGPRYERLKKTLLSAMLRRKDILFSESVDPDGKEWAPLSKKAKARRLAKNTRSPEEIAAKGLSDHKILVDTGRLRNSLTDAAAPYGLRSTDNDEVKLGTNVPYAAIHNFGGTVEHKTLHEVRWSKEPAFMNSISYIPARPFMGFGNDDKAETGEIIQRYIKKNGDES